MKGRLILILGDQLTPAISSLAAADKGRDVVLMCEIGRTASAFDYHKKKLVLMFSAMRHFAVELREAGWTVDYRRLDQTGNGGSFAGEVERAIARHELNGLVVTEPGKWSAHMAMDGWEARFGVPVEIRKDDRFIASREEFAAWARGRKALRMEFFYREMRRKTGLLMEGEEPVGGKWNFDQENRKRASPDLFMPRPLHFEPDQITREVIEMVQDRFGEHFGDLEPFWFAVTRPDAEKALRHFCDVALARFGDFQDAMLDGEAFLYHSVLALYINIGLLDPLDVCRQVERAYRRGDVPLNAAEGYIRQIVGWREYVRGIYWLKMPGYVDENYFGHTRALPWFYWSGETDMACLRDAIGHTKREACAHHIQRLMVTGNFALLAGVRPQEVHAWYLAVYADAYEWVELPNTLGMSQFGDGGLLGSKPYVASGAYINRMSNYCKGCRYDVGKPHGEGACPFNPLYWAFLQRHRDKLAKNPRMAQVYRTWDKLPEERRRLTLMSAETLIERLDGDSKPADTAKPNDPWIASTILGLCRARGAEKSICPSEVARALSPDETWREAMADVRRVADVMAKSGEIRITQRGKPVTAAEARGAIRLSLAAADDRKQRR
ncbi:MAG: cryptochrome/photolyase family protein [Proteobacteria bacterium]|nr:cryptochrome/photolyase family protein [Pseudomonadota bacterium]